MNEYLETYLIGCLLAFIVVVANYMLFTVLAWFRKENIFIANLKKIQEPDENSIVMKAAIVIGGLVFESALSWLGAILNIILGIRRLLVYIRELFLSLPEEIKQLRFPVYNNPYLSREQVWAYITALGIKGGGQVNPFSLEESLNEVHSYHPTFDRIKALDELGGLKVLNPELIKNIASEISSPVDLSDDY